MGSKEKEKPRLQVPTPPVFLQSDTDRRPRFDGWWQQITRYLKLTGIDVTEDKERSCLFAIAMLGVEGERVFEANSTPAQKEGTFTTFETCRDHLKAIFEQPPNPVRARFDFVHRRQGRMESVDDFHTALNALMGDCQYSTAHQKEAVRDQLVVGCADTSVQQQLLAMKEPTLATVLEAMKAVEAAKQASDVIRGTIAVKWAYQRPQGNQKKFQQRKPPQQQPSASTGTSQKGNKCTRCGRNNHPNGEDCPA